MIGAKNISLEGKSGAKVECHCGSREKLNRVVVDGEAPSRPFSPQVRYTFYVCAPCTEAASKGC